MRAYLVRSPTLTTRSVSFDITPPSLINNINIIPRGEWQGRREKEERGEGDSPTLPTTTPPEQIHLRRCYDEVARDC